MLEELSFEGVNEEIAGLANEHLEEGETVMVYCQSELMRDFVAASVERKKLNVVVVVSALGQNCPIERSGDKSLVFITEQSVFSMISKVSKVFMDCHAVMADGAVINSSGTFIVATLAKEYSIPVIILSPMYRFTPFYAFTQDDYNSFVSPQHFFDNTLALDNVEVIVAQYDLIASDCISFVITQMGEFSNNYIYQAPHSIIVIGEKSSSLL